MTKRQIQIMKEAIEYAKKRRVNTKWERDLRDNYIKMKKKQIKELSGVEELNKDAEIFGLGNALKDYKKENRKLKKELAGGKE